MALIEIAILEKVEARIEAITPRYQPDKPFNAWNMDSLEEGAQPGHHRTFQVVWDDENSLPDIFPDNSGTDPHHRRALTVVVVYNVPGRDMGEFQKYRGVDTTDIVDQVVNYDTHFSQADGELYYTNFLDTTTLDAGADEDKIVLAYRFEIQFQRREV